MAKSRQLVHLGVIMDGNRRWAKNRGLPTLQGHRRGYSKMKEITRWCIDRNIKILTVYAFSTENWNRSKKEVIYLMNLFRLALTKDIAKLHRQGVRLAVIGQRDRLATDIQRLIERAEQKTAGNKKLLFQLAVSYGGRAELTEAVKKIIRQKITSQKVNEQIIEKNLWTAGVADPDLIIRTSGEQRLSNFLTWQSAYSELLFIEKHWPAFTENDLDFAIKEFNQRRRRFGI